MEDGGSWIVDRDCDRKSRALSKTTPAHRATRELPPLERGGRAWALKHVAPVSVALFVGALIGTAAYYLRIPFDQYVFPARYVVMPLNALMFGLTYALLIKFVPHGRDGG